ncbi:LysM domain-containing protein [Desulfuromusa kysingii]|uniref:LysM domain-containing protein n=1 Tax=Desulfuromusa kysingii TaxID=37625 RepID=A0A1H3WVS4_9BACT|nr:LysM peptidoglycan-binding domain-containing protein [Desulfuromusa kysingii]SDZ91256.1 LysM domain-containing protein [Desulfuromusa kysingii]
MTRTLFRWLSLLILLLIVSGASLAIAAENQIYTIKKGDTLWDLSKKFIDDPYYWPNIWAKNPEITNPHLIFPGQKVQILDGRLKIIPAYPEAGEPAATATEMQPMAQPTPMPQRETEELVKIKATGSGDGFILTNETPLGVLVDSVDNRILLTKNDTVFLKMKNPADVTVGDTYGLFERGNSIKNPHTNQFIGTMMSNLGFLQVTEINGDTVIAKIATVFREIQRGAELFEYIPLSKEITLQRGTTDKEGYVVAARDEKGTFSTNDIIFVNLGSDDGLVNGNLFYISRPRKASDEMIKHAGRMQLPDAVLGAAITIETKAKTASAIIIKSVDAAFIGDKVSVVTD